MTLVVSNFKYVNAYNRVTNNVSLNHRNNKAALIGRIILGIAIGVLILLVVTSVV